MGQWRIVDTCPTPRLTLNVENENYVLLVRTSSNKSQILMLISPVNIRRLVLLLLLLLLLFVISCTQGIYNHIPETTHVSPHRSCYKFQTVALSAICAMFLLQLFYVLNLPNVFMVRIQNFSLNLFLVFRWLQFYRHNHIFHTAHSCHLYT